MVVAASFVVSVGVLVGLRVGVLVGVFVGWAVDFKVGMFEGGAVVVVFTEGSAVLVV